jgi:hypothetical protein
MSNTSILFVTCCLEPSRAELLAEVIKNLQEQITDDIRPNITVFDNASTEIGAQDVLCDCFDRVYASDRNVGYWSAVDWWLNHLADDPPAYTYIIESDVIHYGLYRLPDCTAYLDSHPDVGSVRTHEYSAQNMHLYNKDRPQVNSKRNVWQSHTNKATGTVITLNDEETIGSTRIWSSNFLTHLPALNRYATMRECFAELRTNPFTELDFQKLYWQHYQKTGIVDGGLFHIDMNGPHSGKVTGSWTDPKQLHALGYQPTRHAAIEPPSEYTVVRLK